MNRNHITSALVALALLSLLVAPAAANNNTTNYYNNSTQQDEASNTTGAGWIAGENATLENLLDMATRLGPVFIGSGTLDQSGTGFTGILILALTLVGSTLTAMRGAGVGPVGGSILGMTLSYGLVEIGFAPPWTKVLLLFGLGIAAAIVIKRSVR